MDSKKQPNHPEEQEAVFTTIVGGRPPGSGTRVGAIPRGVEVLLKKASMDPEFRKLLLEQRGEAAHTIDLELTEAEGEMLAHIPPEQLGQIIDNTKVKPEHKSAFLGSVGRIMLATVVAGAAFVTCVPTPTRGHTATAGISPDRIRKMQMAEQSDANDPNHPDDPNVGDPNVAEQEQLFEASDESMLREGTPQENQRRVMTLGIRPDRVIEGEVEQDDQK
ncbi:MAG: hypothetical protein ACYTAS_17515 [Planctomycetota bacterium]|jgi:hypothetical protein